MDRREFLAGSTAAAISAFFLSSCTSLKPAYSTQNGSAFVFLAQKNGSATIRVMDLNNFTFRDFDVPLRIPHTAQRVLGTEDEFIVFDFMGPAVKVNVKTGGVLKVDSKESFFLGHGVQLEDSGAIWCTEASSSGTVYVRSRKTSDMTLMTGKGLSFEGGHHVVKMPKSRLLASSGYSSKENLSYVKFFDPTSDKVTQFALPPQLLVSHLLPISPDEVVCVSNFLADKGTVKTGTADAPIVSMTSQIIDFFESNPDFMANKGKFELDLASPAPLVYVNTTGEVKKFWDEEQTDLFRFGFGLDGIRNSPRKYVSGHTISNKVIVWNDLAIEKVINVPSPMGVISTPDGKRLVILTMGQLKIYSLETDKFESEIRYDRAITGISRYS